MKLTVSILGSCVSRDIFNRNFISNYKDYFELLSYGHQPSFISIMSDPIPFKYSKMVGKSPSVLDRDHFASELRKPYLDTLLLNQPDILIIDFYADVMYGVVKANDSYILGKSFRFKNFKVYYDLSLGEVLYPRNHMEPFFEL